jgi:ABC-type glycerol-3-phosphate transport system substrate-binding protein
MAPSFGAKIIAREDHRMTMLTRRKMLHSGLAACASLTGFAGTGSIGHARAQDWRAGWDRLIASAEQEGHVVVIAAPNPGQRDYLLAQWKKDFPKIELSLSIHGGSQFVPTVVTERSAGKYLWDVYLSGPSTGYLAIRAGLFDPLVPELMRPDVSDPSVWGGWDDAFYDTEKKFLLGLVSDLQSPYYDAHAIPPEKAAAQGLRLFLDPAYKGKIVWFDPRREGPGSPFMVLIFRVLGAEALWRIMVDQEPFFVGSQPDAATAIVRGKAVLACSGNARGSLEPFRQAGIQFDVRPLGSTPETCFRGTAGSSLAVFTNRPHPNASRLFVNWVMTQKVGEGLTKGQGYDSRRSDVPPLDRGVVAVPGARYVYGTGADNDALLRELITEIKKRRPQ